MREPRSSRRERENERHREEILDAARKLFAERGLAGLTVDSVAREADFAVGSIYRHFRSKEELVEVLAVDLALPMIEEIEALAEAGASFGDTLEAYVRIVARHLIEAQPVVQAFFAAPGELPAPDTPTRAHVTEARDRYFEAVTDIVSLGEEEGLVRRDQRSELAIALHGMAVGFVRWRCKHDEAQVPMVATFIRHFFLNGCGRPTESSAQQP